MKTKAPKLILCDDWREIAKELRKQLKPHGLTVKVKTRREDDQLTWTVEFRDKCPVCGKREILPCPVCGTKEIPK